MYAIHILECACTKVYCYSREGAIFTGTLTSYSNSWSMPNSGQQSFNGIHLFIQDISFEYFAPDRMCAHRLIEYNIARAYTRSGSLSLVLKFAAVANRLTFETSCL